MFYFLRNLILSFLFLGLLSCASGPKSSPSQSSEECFSCDHNNKSWWKSVSLMDLEGTWRGTEITVYKKNQGALPIPKEKEVELSFLAGNKFLRLYGLTTSSCSAFPEESLVALHNILPFKTDRSNLYTFEVLGRSMENYLSFGKVYINVNESKKNLSQKEKKEDVSFSCHYVRLGEFHKNRLKLPSLSYSFTKEDAARSIASKEGLGASIEETDVYFDFFYLMEARKKPNRSPAEAKEIPPVILFEVVSSNYALSENLGRKKWIGTKKRVFKLWPANE